MPIYRFLFDENQKSDEGIELESLGNAIDELTRVLALQMSETGQEAEAGSVVTEQDDLVRVTIRRTVESFQNFSS